MTRGAVDCRALRFDVLETNGARGQSIAEIAARIHGADASLVALDGLPGVGKTTLAVRLSERLSIATVHLDDYLVHGSIGFTAYLRYEELHRVLSRRPVLVEGVCMLDVLDRLALRPDRFIYLEAPVADRHLDQSHPLVREVRAYTDRSRPTERANPLLARSELEPTRCTTWAGRQFSIDAFLLKRRSQISLVLAAAGTIMLAVGGLFVAVGWSGQGDSIAGVGGEDASLIVTGLVTLSMSIGWIVLAWLARSPR